MNDENFDHDHTGQGYLAKELRADPEFATRALTSTVMWISAAIVGIAQQLMPFGIKVTPGDLAVLIGYPVICGTISGFVFLAVRDRPRAHHVVEQCVVFLAWWCIASTVYFTEGATSPFAIYVILPMVYVAYFYHSERIGVIQIVFGSSLTLLPIAYDWQVASTNGFIPFIIVTLFVYWSMCYTISVRRRAMVAAETQARRLSLTDPLTEVANLRAFQEFVRQQIDGRREFGLVVADLDGLKSVNTVAGHSGGDQLIAGIAEVLAAASGPGDQVARIGGDEFAVVLVGATPVRISEWEALFAERIREHNDRVRGESPQVSASVGAAVFPRDGRTLDELTTVADRQMYEQKLRSAENVREILRELETNEPKPPKAFRGPESAKSMTVTMNVLAARAWAASAALLVLAASIPAVSIDHRTGIALVGGMCAAVGIFSYLGRELYPRVALMANEWAAIAIVAPGVWLTGGAKSPILTIGLFLVAFLASFHKPRAAARTVASVIIVFTVAFWTSGNVSVEGETFYTAMINCAVLIALVLQHNAGKLRAAQANADRLAMTDALTGVANRRAFEHHLNQALERAEAGQDAGIDDGPALILIDLDDFKGINTTYGHQGGDCALRTVGAQLTAAAGDDGVAYRIGGDEFAVICHESSSRLAGEVAERCRAEVNNFDPTTEAGALGIEISTSIGYSRWKRSSNLSDMVTRADVALSASKDAGKDAVSFDEHLRAAH